MTSGFAQLNLQAGGPLTATAGTTIQNRGRLSGSGQLNGSVTIQAGGDIVALPGDTLTFDNPVTNGGSVNVINATLNFPGDGNPGAGGSPNDGLTNNTTLNLINAQINGDVHSPTGSTINVAAGVVFNGLVSGGGVSLIDGFAPTAGQQFTILTANSIVNEGLVLGGSAASSFNLLVDGASVILQAIASGVNGDFDFDGDVDGRDFLIWQRAESPSPLSAGDLADWQTNYGVGTLAPSRAVPEPGGALTPSLLCICGMLWSRRPFRLEGPTPLPRRRISA